MRDSPPAAQGDVSVHGLDPHQSASVAGAAAGADVAAGGSFVRIPAGHGLMIELPGAVDVGGCGLAGVGRFDLELGVERGRKHHFDVAGAGDVEVVLPATLDAKFEIETAYTRETAPAHIDSTWELDHQPVTGWDTHEGTARRYVRARGSAGNGRGLVRIKAVNGNVTLRRGR